MIYYDKQLEDFNARMVLKRKLILTNEEAALIEEQISRHFLSIDDYSAQLAADPKNVYAYFGRGMDFMLVQDFAEAISDFSSAIDLDPTFVMAYFNRAVVRYKQMIYDESQQAKSDNFDLSGSIMNLNSTPGQISGSLPSTSDPSSARLKDNKRAYEHEQIVRDYDMVIKLSPDFVYAYFNRGNLRCGQRDFRAAIADYNEAIRRDPEFAEAYFNRGLAWLAQGDANRGIADLSKAGELGIYNAYSIIKRMASR